MRIGGAGGVMGGVEGIRGLAESEVWEASRVHWGGQGIWEQVGQVRNCGGRGRGVGPVDRIMRTGNVCRELRL